MFDQDYFSSKLPKQTREIGGNPIVRVVLHGGQDFYVRSIADVEPGYFSATVYAHNQHEGMMTGPSSGWSGVGAVGPEYVLTVAYENIAHVYVASSGSVERSVIGFNP